MLQNIGSRYAKSTAGTIAFRICMVWIGNNRPFGRLTIDNRFCAKKHLKIAHFGGHESELPDFGRTLTPVRWHQVNCLGAPENFWVSCFKLAIWKVGSNKIERTRTRYIFLMSGHKSSRKSDFWGKTLPNQKYSTVKFFGATTHGILTHSGFRKCNRFGWPSLRFKVIAAQSEVRGQKRLVLQKIRGVTKMNTFVFLVRSLWNE